MQRNVCIIYCIASLKYIYVYDIRIYIYIYIHTCVFTYRTRMQSRM